LAAIPTAHKIWGLEESMQQAPKDQFERSVGEFVRWRAVAEENRSPAPAWWWGPAFEMIGVGQPMPAEWCSSLELPSGSSFAAGAQMFLDCLAGQTKLPWPDDFPGKARHSDPA
jgi:hypothetical protein